MTGFRIRFVIRKQGTRGAAVTTETSFRKATVWAGLAYTVATLCAAAAADAAPLPVIDVHTHVFNLRYLPVRGILIARGVPKPVAEVLDRLLVGATSLADLAGSGDEAPAGAQADAADVGQMSDEAARGYILGRIRRTEADRHPEAGGALLTPSERRALRKYVADQAPQADLAPGEAGDLALVGAALDKARFAPKREKSYPRFLGTLMKNELEIVRAARQDYPGVDLMVHHLMDMERPYGDAPSLSLARQHERLPPLARRFPGQILGFVAFDPFRRAAALPAVAAALQSGAALGVKFYPPSGYRAAGNGAWPDKPSWWKLALRDQWGARYRGWSGEDLDRVTRDFFAYCQRHDVPILAHCTPDGFEAAEGYGAMGDPRYWRAVLEKFPRLRLTLAHAGGGESWFSDGTWTGDADFDQRAWDLATRYEHVYLDLSYSDEVLDPGSLAALRRRLTALLARQPDPSRPFPLGDKLVYGSDWHMVAVLDERARIFAALRGLFDEPALTPYRARFFAGNAARYLRLGAWTAGAPLEAPQRAALEALLARIHEAEPHP
jgi:predicted TIM-barrel fold metal-dependent hydrolase